MFLFERTFDIYELIQVSLRTFLYLFTLDLPLSISSFPLYLRFLPLYVIAPPTLSSSMRPMSCTWPQYISAFRTPLILLNAAVRVCRRQACLCAHLVRRILFS